MTLKATFKSLVRACSDRCQQTASRKLLAAGTFVALSALLAPAAFAHGIDDAPNPFCFIQGPATAGCGTNVTFVATAPSLAGQNFNATWSFLNNNAGATFVGPNFCLATQSCSVTVTTATNGSVVVRVILDFGGGVLKTCQTTLTVAGGGPVSGTCPPDIVVPCPGPIDPSVTGMPTFNTTCGFVTTTFVDTVTGSNCAGSIITRTWTAMNAQGGTGTCTQMISRSSVPIITCPAPITVQCFALVPPPDINTVTAIDSCGGPATVTHVGDVASNGTSNCSNFISRTYRATNACGLTTDCTQTITVSDTTPPSITCPGPVTVQCFSLVPAPSITAVTASDGGTCGGAVTIIHVGDVPTNGSSSCNNVITRTYRATDACGNQGTCTQLITVNDTTPPMLTCPAPGVGTVQCFSLVPVPNIGIVSAADNCGGAVTITFVSDVATNGTSSCNNVITRTYQGVDACGNVGTCTQMLTVNDTTPPLITCPGPVGVQCFSLVPVPNITTVTASDNCGAAPTITFVSDVATNGTSSVNNVITRTYRATDACNNMTTCTQTITVNDTTVPTLTCSGALSVQCFSLVPAPNIASVTATDNCGGAVTVTFTGQTTTNGTSSCGNVVTQTYQGIDLGGNISICTQTITVNDTTPPTMIPCPAPVTVTCFSQVPPPAPTSIVATDNCGGAVVVIHLSDTPSNGNSSCNNVITRTYRATDLCGNQGTCTQLITVNDTTPPVLSCPAPVSVQCFSLLPVPNIGLVSGTDNCGGPVTITFLSDVATNGTSSCNNVITRTYQGVDACGNAGTCTQMITVNDTTPPSITCPGPTTAQCFSLVPAPNITLVTATDNCGSAPTITFVSDVATNGTSSCMNVITRTYRATDGCGNMNTCTQMITVNDTTPPMVNCPGPLSLQCFSLVPAPNIGSVTGTDNCGGPVTITFLSDVAANGTSNCFNVITRTYQGVDACGNMSTCIQTIAVNDTTPPVITSCPTPVTVTCFSLVPVQNPALVTATDNCGGAVTVTFFSDTPSNGTSSCNNVITRTYRATDLCGNFSTCTQLITVNDTTLPVLTCPGPVAVQCFSLVPAANIGLVAATDNCGGVVTITLLSDVATNGTSSCMNVITRTYQGVDPCGNIGTCTQMITVNDTTVPTITCPGPVTAQCFSLVPAPNITLVTATDNCGSAPTITFVSDVPTNGTSSCNNVITRTYRATDACANMATCTQTITVNDTTAPVLTCPAPAAFQCFAQLPTANPALVTATDNCGGAVTVTFLSDVQSNPGSSCMNIVTRTYQGADLCGNLSTCIQTFTVNDTTPPVIICPPDFQAFCPSPTDPGTTGTAVATDNCNPAPTVTFSDVTVGACPLTQTITRTWMASDGCQSVTCVQIITISPPPGPFGCAFSLGGGCGTPAALLSATGTATTITPMVTGATPNSMGFLAADNSPFLQASLIGVPPSCTQFVDPLTATIGIFQTDAAGSWMMAFNVPAFPPTTLRIHLQAAVASPNVGPLGPFSLTNGLDVWRPCPPCTFNRLDWVTAGTTASNLFDAQWLNVFPTGMDIGIFNTAGGNAPPNGLRWTATVAGRNALKSTMATVVGISSPLPADVIDPTSTTSGTLARLTAVLRLNIAFNNAGLISPVGAPNFGNMIYSNPGGLPGGAPDPLSGMTVNQVLAAADQGLAGNGFPAGYGPILFALLLEQFSIALENCIPTGWAGDHLIY